MCPRWPCPMTPEERKLESIARAKRYRENNRYRLKEYDKVRRSKEDKLKKFVRYREYYQANRERIRARHKLNRERKKLLESA